MSHLHRPFWRDPVFLVATGAALLYWGLMFVISTPETDLAWPLREPMRFIYPALLYPVIEEIVFRGVLQEFLQARLRPWQLGPLTLANLLTSLVFTALHFINHPPLWAAAVFLPSLLFGLTKERSGSLTAPIVLHVFYNSGYFWLFTQ
jgi:membrane protease YdiL (CAAX protease family)